MNFIIYEDDVKYSYEYKKVIHKIMGISNTNYKIIEFNSYSDEVWREITSDRSLRTNWTASQAIRD